MSILDMSDALTDFTQAVTLSKLTSFTVDFEDFEECEDSIIQAVIQPAQKEDLNIGNVDWSKSYILIHSTDAFSINDIITWQGVKYKVITRGNFNDYCYYEGIGEQVK
jgi:hypothetical protein